MRIYKHLLEDEKLRNKELERNAEKFKANFSSMAYKNLTDHVHNTRPQIKDSEADLMEKKNKKLESLQMELKDKSEQIRSLKGKLSEVESTIADRQDIFLENKELH